MDSSAFPTVQNGSPLPVKWSGHATFTVEEVGEIFRLSRASAYAAVANGTIGSVRIGRRLMVPRAVIERLLLSSA
jgi:excisionase family DNA binding protein